MQEINADSPIGRAVDGLFLTGAGMKKLISPRVQTLALLAWAAAAFIPQPAQSQSYPTKPVTIIVAYAAGGVADVMARLIANELREMLGQQFIIDNRPGAGGAIGTRACAAASPDGYTLCLGSQ